LSVYTHQEEKDMEKKKKSPFAWPFAKHRQMWIDKADRASSEATEFITGLCAALAEPGSKTWRSYRRGARLFENAGDYYLRAGMNALAKSSYSAAQGCWGAVEDEERRRSCEIRGNAINTYYQEG
jgi:hypothetical protein